MPLSLLGGFQGKMLAVLRKIMINSVEKDLRKVLKKMVVLLFGLSLLETFPDSFCLCGCKRQVLVFHLPGTLGWQG